MGSTDYPHLIYAKGTGKIWKKGVDMNEHYLDSEAIVRSLRIAFSQHTDFNDSIRRIKGMITNLPLESVHIVYDRGRVYFYEQGKTKRVYLRKNSERLYLLARKRYLKELLKMMVMRDTYQCDSEIWDQQFDRLASLIRDFAKGNLELARIVLTPKQYEWFTRSYKQKQYIPEPGTKPLATDHQIIIRSKSEQNIGNALERFAAAYHYEEQLQINVQRIVEELEKDLIKTNQLNGPLFYYRGKTCYWNVPDELQFLNAQGSMWHTYNYRTGCVLIHPDFKIMLSNGDILFWEHEGLIIKFIYRVNSMERIAIMRICGGIDARHIIETTEAESSDKRALEEIIKREIIPRMWF